LHLHNDGLFVFSDGVSDNLHDHEILHIVDCALTPGLAELTGLPDRATPPICIAKAVAQAAYDRSIDPNAKVPFSEEYSRQKRVNCSGGKQDDITVVAAWVR